jgi:hypothetical protein
LQIRRLAKLRSLVLEAGFYQELTGLPASLASLRLHRNVVYVRLLGACQSLLCNSQGGVTALVACVCYRASVLLADLISILVLNMPCRRLA